MAAWVVNKDETPVFTNPEQETFHPIISNLAGFLQESLNVRPYNDSYYEIGAVFGIGKDGYVEQEHIVVWNEQPPPEEIEEDEWIDIDIEEQFAVLRQGRNTLFVTLISSAKEESKHPQDCFASIKKQRCGIKSVR